MLARATAAEIPLPGAQPDASVVLHPLLCAEVTGPPGWFHRSGGRAAGLKAFGVGVPQAELIQVPIVAFLIEHPTAGAVLVDTGFHSSALTDPRQNLGWLGALMSRGLKMEPSQTAAAQCTSRGVDPQEVRFIVMTHLHFDHASALVDFPAATVLVSELEWQAANARTSTFGGYCKAQLDPGLSYKTVDFGSAAACRRGPFERTLDLFGDGSIALVDTPGHSAGHMSVIARLAEREALLAGDAIYTMATLRDGERPWRVQNEARFEKSVQALRAYDEQNPQSLIIPGHDMAAWKELDPIYS